MDVNNWMISGVVKNFMIILIDLTELMNQNIKFYNNKSQMNQNIKFYNNKSQMNQNIKFY